MPAATIDFGIDLGTTNSSIACCRNAQVKVFQNNELMTVTPSVVYIAKSGRMLVGKRAYDTWTSDPENTHAEFKRWIGLSDRLLFPASNRQMASEELSAEVLKSLRDDVRRTTGDEINAAVITVPAAFGALQCEATARAAKLAGFLHAPLLQEPIAAAIACGASATGASQRWLVFDLGGGTLDVAVVSTRNGKLSVLEHQGNNRLGGKDIDRLIVQKLLLPPLTARFKLPTPTEHGPAYDRLFRNLVRASEIAKITLTTSQTAPVELLNIGDDLEGKPIETEILLARSQLEPELQPILDKCLDLVHSALKGARLAADDIDRVILVGGPTQMPAIRNALVAALGNKLDFSVDPMTVVAQGAAIYASTMDNPVAAATPKTEGPASTAAVTLQLNHERASGTPMSPVAGTLSGPAKSSVHEIRIDADGGFWSSGWIPVVADRFTTQVMLAPGKPATHYVISARSKAGASVVVEPGEFSIAFMLAMGSIPLPHTIAVETTSNSGSDSFDPIFKRHTPLPAEVRKTYRAERTLRPSDISESLPIKFWEIEVSEDPSEKWWAGCIKISAEILRRPLLEGADIEITFRIDTSRKMRVDGFIPSLNQAFADEVYIPDPPSARSLLQTQLDLCFERIHRLFKLVYGSERDELAPEIQRIELQLEELAEHLAREMRRTNFDPDAMLAPTDELRKLRLQINRLEEQLESGRQASSTVIALRGELRYTQQVVENYGKQVDREACATLATQFERYAAADDQRGLRYVQQQLSQLRGSILVTQRSVYEEWRDYYLRTPLPFLNQQEAMRYLEAANNASRQDDFPALREAIHRLHALTPRPQLEAAEDQLKRSGLKES